MRTRVKICGITRPEDGRAAADLGADAIGLVFYPGSPRAVSVALAQAIVAVLPPFVTTVGLFVDADEATVKRIAAEVPLDLLQFHGMEQPDFCGAFGRPYIKAVGMRPGVDLEIEAERFAGAAGLLVDAWDPKRHGGTGEQFDWARLPEKLPLPLILAGGLGPDNVAEAITRVRPWAVDVSSGVEAAKGIKDRARMAAFMRGVESA